MTVAELDNGIDGEAKRAITWQFDQAPNLIGAINELRDFFNASTKQLWDGWQTDVASIDTATDFGLSIWGKLLACRRPDYLSSDLYRKLLKARFQLLGRHGTFDDYCEYVYTVFGGKVEVIEGTNETGPTGGNAMTLSFAVKSGETLTDEETQLLADEDTAFVFPLGVHDNVLRDRIAFGYCGLSDGSRPPDSWDGTFPGGTLEGGTEFPGGTLSKMDAETATFIWR